MTSIPAIPSAMPNEFSSIAGRLDTVGNQFRLVHVLRALAHFVIFAAPVVIGVALLAGWLNMPGWANLILGVLLLGAIVLAYLRTLHRPLFTRPTYAQIARWVEENADGKNLRLHNHFINAVLLAQEYHDNASATAEKKRILPHNVAWIPHVLKEIDNQTAASDLQKSVPWEQSLHSWLKSGVVLLAVLLVAALFHNTLAHGFAVLTSPGKFVPIQGRVKILSVDPGNDTVLAGQPETFIVHVDSPDKKVVDAKITLAFRSGKTISMPMTSPGSDLGEYKYIHPAIAEDVDYFITAGDTQSERFHLAVLPQINVLSYQIEAIPPAYTGMDTKKITIPGKDLTAIKGSIEVPLGSQLTVSTALDIPVKEAFMDIMGGKGQDMLATPDGKGFSAIMPLRDTFHFAIQFNDANNRTLRHLPDAGTDVSSQFTLTATPDEPPTMDGLEPGRDLDAKPGEAIPVSVTANDDYGLTEMRLEIAAGTQTDWSVLERWPVGTGPKNSAIKTYKVRYMLQLAADKYKLGDTLRYRFVAVDNRNLTGINPDFGPQSTMSPVFSINLTDTAASAAKTTENWENLRRKLQALLEQQVKLREQSNGLTASINIDDAKKLAADIGAGQQSLRADMSAIAKDFPFETSMKLIQKSLLVLVTEDATYAVDRAADIGLLADVRTLTPVAGKLRRHQSRIIDVLEALLAISTTEEKAPTAVAKEGDTMPNDAKDAWTKMLADLKKFQDEQKAVIDSTADLAKKPKDEFDKDDKEKLANAAAVEDKWEKFMNQAMVDMSKLAEQDQANASLLDELVQMKIELAMAKDALQTKAAQIATPLEENGLENAKALTTHIERWLEHAPDRTQWEMEEPVTQNDPSMAELPKQLQDMVGDLMDQEEDETQQMESLGSKFADSLDKGAGWGAADGPISNMSAQGVTGNQMPKNDEIQGRSGDGREGRASGEMVGNTAEDKGGRRTPTRMTPEPFSSGKVDDKSNEPAGGATGGGKKAGWGGEGLEGPAPEPMHDPMQRLAGKQAELHNQDERLKLQMRAQGFNNFKLIEAGVLMQRADEALRQYHYDTALRYQNEAVESLNTAKVLAAGQVHVTLDTSPAVSEKTQKDIDDALHGAMPKGYADPVKAYFEKLSTDQP